MAWYNASWSYKKSITLSNSVVTATQTDFPVLIYLETDSDLAADALANANDIIFVNGAEDTLLDYHVVTWDDSTGELAVYVKIPSLSSASSTTIYMYYGNSGASNQEDAAGVWSAWDAVFMMNESSIDGTANEIVDFTGNGYDAAGRSGDYPTPATDALGLPALSFDGDGNAVITGDFNFGSQAAVTCIAFVQRNAAGDDERIVGNTWGTAVTDLTWFMGLTSSDALRARVFTNTAPHTIISTSAINNDEPTILAVTWSATTDTHHYYDDTDGTWHDYSSSVSGDSFYGSTGVDYVTIGNTGESWGNGFNGFISRVRISTVALDEDYLETTRNIETDPSGWYTLGSEETDGSNTTITPSTASASASASVASLALTNTPSIATSDTSASLVFIVTLSPSTASASASASIGTVSQQHYVTPTSADSSTSASVGSVVVRITPGVATSASTANIGTVANTLAPNSADVTTDASLGTLAVVLTPANANADASATVGNVINSDTGSTTVSPSAASSNTSASLNSIFVSLTPAQVSASAQATVGSFNIGASPSVAGSNPSASIGGLVVVLAPNAAIATASASLSPLSGSVGAVVGLSFVADKPALAFVTDKSNLVFTANKPSLSFEADNE